MKPAKAPLIVTICILLLCSGACKKSDTLPNRPPVAKAGKDTAIFPPLDSMILDGSQSFDWDNNISGYRWTKISGPSSYSISNPVASNTVVSKLIPGIYLFELMVSDKEGLLARDTVRVSVGNRPPVADAGGDTTLVLPHNMVVLDGSASTDPDANIVSYTWRQVSGPATYSLASTGFEKRVLSDLGAGDYLFELKVTDAGGLYANDTVAITVVSAISSAQEIIFPDLMWKQDDFYGLDMIDTYVGTPAKPELFMNSPQMAYSPELPRHGEVYIKTDNSDFWIQVPTMAGYYLTPEPRYYYDIESPSLFVHSPLVPHQVGSKASLKVRFP